ncbi:MAG: pectate lyase [Armatimonadota bacterium]
MLRTVAIIATLSLASVMFSPATHTVMADDELPAVEQVEAAMMNAAEAFHRLSYEGAHVDSYSVDLQERYDGRHGTRRAFPADEPDWAETEPPTGGTIGQALLRAWRVTGDERYLEMAQEIADALAIIQTDTGGWPARARLSQPPGSGTRSDLDDNRTQSTVRFFVDLVATGESERHREVMQRGLDFILEAQYPSGGWPQYYPAPEDQNNYQRYHTLNDASMPDNMRTLLTAWRALGEQEYLDAVIRAADWLLEVRLPNAGWAQQYYDDFVSGPLIPNHPAPARWFEPIALVSSESGSVIRILTEVWLETGDDRYIAPFDEVADWFERSRLDNGLWARFYELHTNRPLYCTPDRIITHSDENLRPGYAWQRNWGEDVFRTVERVKTLGRDGLLAERETIPDDDRVRSLGERAQRAIDTLDDRGYWTYERFVGAVVDHDDERIWTREFVSNMNAMSAYLEALEDRGELDR